MNRSTAGVSAVATATLAAAVLAAPALAASSPGWQVSEHEVGYSTIQDIVVTSATNAWAIGQVAPKTTLDTQVQEWNGTSWRTVGLPANFAYNATLASSQIAATSASDMWLAADDINGNNTLLHWNGKSWDHLVKYPLNVQIADLIALSPTDYWAFGRMAGNDTAWHFNGTSWLPSAAPTYVYTPRQASQTQGTIWTLSFRGTGASTDLILHSMSGGKWASVPAESLNLPKGASVKNDSIVALGPADIWVSLKITGSNGSSWPALLNYDGGKWSRVTAPSIPGVQENVVTSDGSGSIWYLVQQSNRNASYAFHYVAGKWVQYSLPVTKGWTSEEILATSLIPGTTSVWVAGQQVNPSVSGGSGIILAYHG